MNDAVRVQHGQALRYVQCDAAAAAVPAQQPLAVLRQSAPQVAALQPLAANVLVTSVVTKSILMKLVRAIEH